MKATWVFYHLNPESSKAKALNQSYTFIGSGIEDILAYVQLGTKTLWACREEKTKNLLDTMYRKGNPA